MLGTVDVDVEGDKDYNAALLISPAHDVQIYHKLHLVPFGEYVPFRHSFPLFAWLAGDQVPGDFAVGKDYTVFRLSGDHGYAAPLICFEDTIGELVRHFVLPHNDMPGATVLVNVTNDGWFLHSPGSKQHLANAIFRCVETRRPMVRGQPTGVTCVLVNQFGRITQILADDAGDTFSGRHPLAGELNVPTGTDSSPFMSGTANSSPIFVSALTVEAAVALGIILSRRAPANHANSDEAA